MHKIQLEQFEGPLDLLLSLIAKNEVNLCDIPIIEITSQYMQYLYSMEELNIDIASEFIVVAAQLIQIKSKMLLPADDEEDEELEDSKEMLLKRLIEYKIYKEISVYIKDSYELSERIFYKDPTYFPELEVNNKQIRVTEEQLFKAIKKVIANHRLQTEEKITDYTIEKEIVHVSDKISLIGGILSRQEKLSFFSLFEGTHSNQHIVASLLAMLEMMKLNLIRLVQENQFEDIMIYRTQELAK